VLSPTLLLVGSSWNIAFNTFTAAVGVYIVSVAMVGFFTRPLGVVARLVLAFGGLAAFFPDTAVGATGLVSLPGIAVSAALLGREYLAGSKSTRTRAAPAYKLRGSR
jgi:TRAP-type uncharacterized transport system fused permease subunit